MPDVIAASSRDQLATECGSEACAGLTDGDLLGRFRTSRDERAFEAPATASAAARGDPGRGEETPGGRSDRILFRSGWR